MELAVLAAGIDAVRQVGQERGIELAAAEAGVEETGVDGDDSRAIPRREQFVDQRAPRLSRALRPLYKGARGAYRVARKVARR